MKKILAVLLAVALVATLSLSAVMTASADGDPTIVISSRSATRGSEVDVTISLINNPGIGSMRLSIAFPSDLTLVSVGTHTDDGNYTAHTPSEPVETPEWVKYDITEKGGYGMQPRNEDDNSKPPVSPVTLNWVSPLSNVNDAEMTFATLRFKVAENAEFGDKDIAVTYQSNYVYKNAPGEDPDTQEITFQTVAGKVTVTDVLKGDVDGDGVVTSDDAILVLNYSLLPDLYEVNQDADFDGDGVVTSDDAILLLNHSLLPDLYPLN